MKRLAIVMFSLSLPAVASGQQKANLKKLLDPLTQRAEIEAITGNKLRSYRLHWCTQSDKSPPLLILASSADYSQVTSDPYSVARPEELFGDNQGIGGIPGPSPATLTPIVKMALLVLDSDGKEVPAWKSDNYENTGYLHDFNGDGVLDRAGSVSVRVAGRDDLDVEVFQLRTLERKPRPLLRVVFNWRPDWRDDDDWKATCEDRDQDGIPEIAFGPKSADTPEDARRVVIGWKADTGTFEIIEAGRTTDDQRHVRILKEGSTLEALAKKGGLGYAVTSKDDREHAIIPQQPYVFKSLKEATDVEMHAFFDGKERERQSFGSSVKTLLPDNFWALPAKSAALAYAKENQQPGLRARWQLAVDDRGEAKPPSSGWLTYSWGSSSCYSYSSADFALRFGVPEPWLLITEFNRHGVVGADPMVDRPGYRIRIIPLKAEDARFLADTIFWLNRIRSRDRMPELDEGRISLFSCTADGSGSFLLRGDHVKPLKLASETVWAICGISENWKEGYKPDVFVNLGDWLLRSAVPTRFQDAWQQTRPLDHRNLTMPLAERLTERTSADEKVRLDETATEIFRRHTIDPIPPEILAKVVECAGTERLSGQQAAIEALLEQLPAATDGEKELRTLELRQQDDARLKKRREELQGKYEFDRGYLLREPLLQAADQLRLAANPAALMEESRKNTPLSQWALKVLQSDHPGTYADVLIERFKQEDLEGRRRVFTVLGTFLPKRAKELAAMLDRQQQIDLVIEVVTFQLEQDAAEVQARVPDLMALISDEKGHPWRKGMAMSLLGEMKLDEATNGKLEKLLLAEIKRSQKEEDGSPMVVLVAQTLSKLPGAHKHLDLIARVGTCEWLARATRGREDQKEWLTRHVSRRLHGHGGGVDQMFWEALSYDLHGLAAEIEKFATEDPQKEEGAGALYSESGFKGPQGQKYHRAREITALWREPDARTRARMWVCLVLHQGVRRGLIKKAYDPDRAFVAGAKEALVAIPAAERRPMIESLIASGPVEGRDAEKEWLRQLAEEP